MNEDIDIFEEFKERGNRAVDDVAQLAIKNIAVLKKVFEGAGSPSKRIKNAAGKTLQIISEIAPQKLYLRFNYIVNLIEGEDTILKWIAIDMVGNLSGVDRENKINKKFLTKLYDLLSDESMITAGHSIETLGKIARNKARYRKEITTELLKVEKIERNEECRNIHIGQTIQAFSEYVEFLKDKKPILAFAKRAVKNSRNATKRKAERFLSGF
ncbi:MAG: hypothetical protein JSV84_08955 [Gemmatimonadota bacterium]|nr:MAG: hypothetical protein JSV84_08955 [Gemmatimonadota bacterium]